MVERAWDYRWSSAGFYVKRFQDGVTNADVYLGADKMSGRDRRAYGEALMATADEEWMRKQARTRVIGSAEFSSQLKVQKGRLRRKRGRPVKGV